MTRVCVRCGWLVLEGERCTRDRGPSLDWRLVAKACRVRTLRDLLNLAPVHRVIGLVEARDRLRDRPEAGGAA